MSSLSIVWFFRGLGAFVCLGVGGDVWGFFLFSWGFGSFFCVWWFVCWGFWWFGFLLLLFFLLLSFCFWFCCFGLGFLFPPPTPLETNLFHPISFCNTWAAQSLGLTNTISHQSVCVINTFRSQFFSSKMKAKGMHNAQNQQNSDANSAWYQSLGLQKW